MDVEALELDKIIEHRFRREDVRLFLHDLLHSNKDNFLNDVADILVKVTALLEVSSRVAETLSLELLLKRLSEVTTEALKVLKAVSKLEGFDYSLTEYDFGGQRYLKTGEILPAGAIDELRQCNAIFLGAIGHPDVPPGVLERGLLLQLRFEFDQYINLRPVKLFPGVETPLAGKGPEHINFVVVRENTEDMYAGMSRILDGLPGTVDGGRAAMCQPADGGAPHLSRNQLYRFEVAGRAYGEPGFDDVNAQLIELARDGELLLRRQACACRLLSVPERGIKDDDGVARLDSDARVRAGRDAGQSQHKRQGQPIKSSAFLHDGVHPFSVPTIGRGRTECHHERRNRTVTTDEASFSLHDLDGQDLHGQHVHPLQDGDDDRAATFPVDRDALHR